jgi:dTDP-4-dehydrorhamnose reductase
MKILVTGKNGQLGSEINSLVTNYPQHHFHFTGSSEFNLSSKESADFSALTINKAEQDVRMIFPWERE